MFNTGKLAPSSAFQGSQRPRNGQTSERTIYGEQLPGNPRTNCAPNPKHQTTGSRSYGTKGRRRTNPRINWEQRSRMTPKQNPPFFAFASCLDSICRTDIAVRYPDYVVRGGSMRASRRCTSSLVPCLRWCSWLMAICGLIGCWVMRWDVCGSRRLE